jgi:hypothetical protein
MSVNCENCGAPPKTGIAGCLYCGTGRPAFETLAMKIATKEVNKSKLSPEVIAFLNRHPEFILGSMGALLAMRK